MLSQAVTRLVCRYPLAMEEDANFTGQYAAQLDTNILLPDLAYSNAATLSFCDSVRLWFAKEADV